LAPAHGHGEGRGRGGRRSRFDSLALLAARRRARTKLVTCRQGTHASGTPFAQAHHKPTRTEARMADANSSVGKTTAARMPGPRRHGGGGGRRRPAKRRSTSHSKALMGGDGLPAPLRPFPNKPRRHLNSCNLSRKVKRVAEARWVWGGGAWRSLCPRRRNLGGAEKGTTQPATGRAPSCGTPATRSRLSRALPSQISYRYIPGVQRGCTGGGGRCKPRDAATAGVRPCAPRAFPLGTHSSARLPPVQASTKGRHPRPTPPATPQARSRRHRQRIKNYAGGKQREGRGRCGEGEGGFEARVALPSGEGWGVWACFAWFSTRLIPRVAVSKSHTSTATMLGLRVERGIAIPLLLNITTATALPPRHRHRSH
jgi:hypothetical protein